MMRVSSWAAAAASAGVWSSACSGGEFDAGGASGGGAATSSGGAVAAEPLGTLEGAEDLARFMDRIALPLVNLLVQLKNTSANEANCVEGGTVVIDRDLGEATFSACSLDGIVLSGAAVVADGGTDAVQSSILAGGAFELSGDATGSVLIQLAQLTWQTPPDSATTTWRATFDSGMSMQICVQSSGDPC